MLHAEALLLVDDEETEVLEAHVTGQEAVGRDHDVDRPVADTLYHGGLLLGGQEPRQHLDAHRVVREALAERLAVLVGEQRHEGEEGEQRGGRSLDGEVVPLALRLHAQMGAHFLKGGFQLPALHEPGEDLHRLDARVGAQQRLGANLLCGSRIRTQRIGTTGWPL